MPSGDKGPGWQNHEYFKGTDGKRTAESKANFRKEWAEIITALKPFGCIGVWVPFNESWGQFDTESIVAETAALDSTRLINSASGGNFFRCGDILPFPNRCPPYLCSCRLCQRRCLWYCVWSDSGWQNRCCLWRPEYFV